MDHNLVLAIVSAARHDRHSYTRIWIVLIAGTFVAGLCQLPIARLIPGVF